MRARTNYFAIGVQICWVFYLHRICTMKLVQEHWGSHFTTNYVFPMLGDKNDKRSLSNKRQPMYTSQICKFHIGQHLRNIYKFHQFCFTNTDVFCRYNIWGNAFNMIDEISTWMHWPVGTTSSNQVLHLTICALPVISDDVQKVKGQQYFCIPGFLPQLKKLVLLSYFSQCIRHALKLYQSCDRDKTFW